MNAGLPPHVQSEVQRILDAAARRILAEQLDRDALTPCDLGRDGDLCDANTFLAQNGAATPPRGRYLHASVSLNVKAPAA